VIGYIWVGNVRFVQDDESPDVCTCSLCARKLPPSEVATHARKRHKALSCDVLPGQLGIPGSGVPDVPVR
jgi:hypothetical protein